MWPPKADWTLLHVLDQQVNRNPSAACVEIVDGPSLSYADVLEDSRRLACGLHDLGVRKGDSVLFMLPNCLESVLTWFATNLIGAVCVPINIEYRGHFIEHVLNDSRGKVLVVARQFLPVLVASESNLVHLKTLVVVDDGSHTEDELILAHLHQLSYLSVASAPPTPPPVVVAPSDIANVIYTSGTTGPSKGVLMPYGHGWAYARQTVDYMGMCEGDVYYICLPMFHANAQFLQIYPTLQVGGKFVLDRRFSASRWLNRIREYGATLTSCLGVMADWIMAQPVRPDDSNNPLRVALIVPLPESIGLRFEQRFGVRCVEGYGMTEIGMPLWRMRDAPLIPGSCGRVAGEWFDVALLDPETDEPVEAGQVGEICVRPRYAWTIMQGYHALPDKTVATWRNLWFHTGDAARTDSEGNYYFVDRIKDYIRVRGENISSYEVERIFNEHPAVLASAAVGIRSEYSEDEVKICVVLREGDDISAQALLNWARERLPKFAVPRYLEFFQELPKTPTQKVQKHMLRSQGITPSTWDQGLRRGSKCYKV